MRNVGIFQLEENNLDHIKGVLNNKKRALEIK